MLDPSGERLLWRVMERLEAAERELLKPGPSGLGDLVDNLEEGWRELCAAELRVRADGEALAWRATLESELEEVRGRVSRLMMLLDHARRMVDGWELSGVGAYGGGGLVSGRLDEEG